MFLQRKLGPHKVCLRRKLGPHMGQSGRVFGASWDRRHLHWCAEQNRLQGLDEDYVYCTICPTDLLGAVGVLSTMITKWDTLCDRKLLRIIKYMNGTTQWRQIGFVGDTPGDVSLGLFSDADFAGDHAGMRSTSGIFLALYGPSQLLPIDGAKQEANGCLAQYR